MSQRRCPEGRSPPPVATKQAEGSVQRVADEAQGAKGLGSSENVHRVGMKRTEMVGRSARCGRSLDRAQHAPSVGASCTA
eukprot:255855-Prymnesium_polylepis.2